MADENVLILISDAPAHIPAGQVVELYIDGRTKHIGDYKEELKTSERMKLVSDDLYENRLVQAIVYDKYKIEFIKKENYAIELIQYAKDIKIYDYTDNSEHHARIINFTSDAIPNSSAQKITIEYYDNYTYNYYNGSNVANMLRSDTLSAHFDPSKAVRINLTFASTSYNFYSPFYSEQFIDIPIKEESELEGINKLTRIVRKYRRRLVLYCNESDTVDLEYYGNICNNYNGTMYFYEDSTYTAIETPEITIAKEQQGIDLYKVEIKMTTHVIDFNPYSYTP